MKKNIIQLFLGFLLINSCSNNNSFEEFDITYSNFFQAHNSIKLTKSDTVFIRKYYENFELEHPYYHENYYTILNKDDRKKINNTLKNIKLEEYDSAYLDNNLFDGFIYKLYLKKNNTEKTVLVYSRNSPEELDSLTELIISSIENLKLHKTDKKFEIKSQDIFPEPEKITE